MAKDADYYDLQAQIAGLSDVVSRLLALEANRSGDAEAFFQEISDATGHHIYRTEKESGLKPTEGAMILQEKIQAQVDMLIQWARAILAA